MYVVFHKPSFFFILTLFKAKLLEQIDEEFGVSTLINEESEKRKQKVFTKYFTLKKNHYFIHFRNMHQKI